MSFDGLEYRVLLVIAKFGVQGKDSWASLFQSLFRCAGVKRGSRVSVAYTESKVLCGLTFALVSLCQRAQLNYQTKFFFFKKHKLRFRCNEERFFFLQNTAFPPFRVLGKLSNLFPLRVSRTLKKRIKNDKRRKK